MPIDIVLKKQKCACCGSECNAQEVIRIKEEESKNLTLTNYFDFLYVPVNMCDNCGYANTNLEVLTSPLTKRIVASENYQTAVDNGFMDEFLDLDEDEEYLNTNAGALDGMAYILNEEKNNSLTFAIILSKIANTKSVLRGYHAERYYDSDDNNYKIECKKLLNALTEQIEKANTRALEILNELPKNNPYEIIFYAELLTRLNYYNKARELVDKLNQTYIFDEELNNYLDNMLTQPEVID